MPLVKCPTCGKENEYTDNEFRPFCSGRCQLTDLGAWADEQFALPDESTPLTEEEMEKVEQALEAKARAGNED